MQHARVEKAIYQRNDGADEDIWRLVLDTDVNRLFIEHEARRGDVRGRGYGLEIEEMEIADYLAERSQGRDELVRLLTALFEEPALTAA